MIPPSLLTGSLLLTLIPIWEDEPAPTPESCPSSSDGAQSNTDGAATSQPAGDADGVNDQAALRRVLKGYRLGLTTDWNVEANPGYERWVDNRSDNGSDDERQRQVQRLRSAAPNPSNAAQPSDSTPPAGTDTAE